MRMFLLAGLILGSLTLTAAAPADGDNRISIDNFTFSPLKLVVAKGTEVTWTNQDDIPHSIVLGAIGVRSKAFDTDGSFLYKFDKAGIFTYTCGLHPQMHGQIVVK